MYIVIDEFGNVWTQKELSEGDYTDANNGYTTIIDITFDEPSIYEDEGWTDIDEGLEDK